VGEGRSQLRIAVSSTGPASSRRCAAVAAWSFAWRTIWTGCPSSARALSISLSYDKAYIACRVDRLLQANELPRHAAADPDQRPSGPARKNSESRPCFITHSVFGRTPGTSEYYETAARVLSCPVPVPAECDGPHVRRTKTTCYYPRLLRVDLAHRKRAAEALWFTTDNRLAEGCSGISFS